MGENQTKVKPMDSREMERYFLDIISKVLLLQYSVKPELMSESEREMAEALTEEIENQRQMELETMEQGEQQNEQEEDKPRRRIQPK